VSARAISLGEVTETVMGQAPPGAACNKDGKGTVFVKAGEFSDIQPVVREWTTLPLKFAKKGDVLVCVVGATSGKINLGIDCAIGRSVAAVRPNPKRLDTGYLHYFLRTRTERLRGASQGLAQGVITREMLSKIEIPLPSLDEQRRIAAILDKAHALRRKRKHALALLDSLTQSIFMERFGSPMTGPETVKLADVCSRITDGVHQKPDYTETGIPFISVKDITTGKLILNKCKFISESDHDKYTKRCKPELGDILYTKVGATYGRPALVDTDRPFSIYVSVALIKPKRDLIRPKYLKVALSMPVVKAQADRRIKGIGVPDLHLDQIQSFIIPLPSLSEQAAFERAVENFERLACASSDAILKHEELFSSLQSRAFSGQL
jgi:type I restriction enzyme, S subunit